MEKESNPKVSMEEIVSLCKRRGFIYPSCEIYGGFANSYSYGPYGAQLKKNIKDLWWNKFIESRRDMLGIDGPIILNPKVWEASGHTSGFNDAMVDCKECQSRYRADHLVLESTGEDLEGNLKGLNKALLEKKIKCPNCNKHNWAEARFVNMMFKTNVNGFEGDVFLRPETAGSIFVEFKAIIDSMRVRIPFGIGQIGKAFRNEIIARNFIFRLREFEQMEIEYFIHPEADWESIFNNWLESQEEFAAELGILKSEIRRYQHPKDKLSHYSKKTVDIEYDFPFGFSELYGLANRTDFDLSSHQKASGVELSYLDPITNERYIPHVIEPTFGLDRSILAALCSAYTIDEANDNRVVLKFPYKIAPIKIAIFPLLKNKEDIVKKALAVFDSLSKHFNCEFDDNGNIGKRYRRQDEIGTPFCVTIDFDTLEDNTVTVRDRDSMEQKRIAVDELIDFFSLNT